MGPDLTKFLAGNANFIVLPNGHKLPSRNLTKDAPGRSTAGGLGAGRQLRPGMSVVAHVNTRAK